MQGLANMLAAESHLSEKDLRQYMSYMVSICKELDDYTRNLNAFYQQKKEDYHGGGKG